MIKEQIYNAASNADYKTLMVLYNEVKIQKNSNEQFYSTYLENYETLTSDSERDKKLMKLYNKKLKDYEYLQECTKLLVHYLHKYHPANV